MFYRFKRKREKAQNNHLVKTFSQNGEDLIIKNLINIIGLRSVTYLDLGCNHPFQDSNTALVYLDGAHGFAVDANPNYIKMWKELRPKDKFINLGVGIEETEIDFYMIDEFSGRNTFDKKLAEEFVQNNPNFRIKEVRKIKILNINNIVEEYMGGVWPNILDIDIEGLDQQTLKMMNFSQNCPDIICIEITGNSDGSDNIAHLLEILEEKDHFAAFRTCSNLISVNNKYKEILAIY